MKTYMKILCVCLTLALVNTGFAAKQKPQYQDNFRVIKENLVSVGKNKYFILIPGYCLHFKDGKDSLTITVLNETKIIDGVETRVVEERETAKGELVEVSKNYFAIDRTTNAVYYFGESVEIYKKGKIISHEGSWQAGFDHAKFGLMMPAAPKVGDRYYQEIALDKAMDRAEIVSLTDKVTVPAGTYENCLKIKETSHLEKDVDTKIYAPGVGLIKDNGFVLIKIDKPIEKENSKRPKMKNMK